MLPSLLCYIYYYYHTTHIIYYITTTTRSVLHTHFEVHFTYTHSRKINWKDEWEARETFLVNVSLEKWSYVIIIFKLLRNHHHSEEEWKLHTIILYNNRFPFLLKKWCDFLIQQFNLFTYPISKGENICTWMQTSSCQELYVFFILPWLRRFFKLEEKRNRTLHKFFSLFLLTNLNL